MATLTLPKAQHERLKEAAFRYGFSPEELSRRIIADATSQLLSIPEESLDEYENPDEILNALRLALRAERKGGLLSSLPRSSTRRR